MAIVYEELQARIRAVARPEEDPDLLLETAVQEFITRRGEEAARWDAARAEAQAILNGPRRPYDGEATYQRYRAQFGWTEDLSGLTQEELIDRYEAGLDSLPADKIAEARRLGLL